MSDVKWIKIVTDIFDDEKILLIESMPEADSLIVIWFKLICLAGKNNNSGVFIMNNKIPYTEEMLATIFRRKVNTVKLALDIFKQFSMIEIVDNVITIPNWSKHQSLDKLEAKSEYMREYMRDRREKQRLIATGKDCKVNSKSNSKSNVNHLELDIEEDKEKEVDNISIKEDKSSLSVKTDLKIPYKNIMDYFNTYSFLKPITAITDKRKNVINARVREHGIDSVYKMIDQIQKSSFLKGENRNDWVATFDWCFKPNNFIKVLEGNYRKGQANKETLLEKVNRENEELQQFMGFEDFKTKEFEDE